MAQLADAAGCLREIAAEATANSYHQSFRKGTPNRPNASRCYYPEQLSNRMDDGITYANAAQQPGVPNSSRAMPLTGLRSTRFVSPMNCCEQQEKHSDDIASPGMHCFPPF